MAIYKKEEVNYGGSCELPKDRYTVRIVSVTKKQSSTNKPMAIFKVEIVAPEQVTINGLPHNIGGRQFAFNQMLDPVEDYGVGRLIAGLERAGFDFSVFEADGALDDDKLPKLNGFCFDMILGSRPRYAQRPPSEAEKVAGKKEYIDILDASGKRIMMGYEVTGGFADVVGPASVNPENSY